MHGMLEFHATSPEADKTKGLSHPDMWCLFEDLILSETEEEIDLQNYLSKIFKFRFGLTIAI